MPSKQYSESIDFVKLRYNSTVGGAVRGIGLVSRYEHFREMLTNVVGDRRIKAKRVLFDRRYSAWDN